MTVTDIMGIRLLNTQMILGAVRFEDAITKREIAERTGLSFATVSNLCNELMDQGLLRTVKNNAVTVGRTPQFLTCDYNHYCTVALNLQMDSVITLGVANFRNQLIVQREFSVSPNLKAEDVIHLAKSYFDSEIQPHVPEGAHMIGIGVAVSSIFDIHTSNLICCAIPQFENVNIKKIVEQEFCMRAYVDNEANLCACALLTLHHSKESVVYVHASEGVGVGIIVQGTLMNGSNGYAGEVAHMPIGNMEHYCKDCCSYGCIERELCVDGILENYLGTEPIERFSQWREFLASVEKRDENAMKVVADTGFYLGKLLSVLVNLFDPSAVYIGGDIADLHAQLDTSVKETIERSCGNWRTRQPQIVWDENSEMRIHIGISERICSTWSPNS